MTRVLVPIAVLDGEAVASGVADLLSTVDVTVLGYHVLPEQTPPDQARLQYEDRAVAALEDLEAEFRSAGGAADHRLVFTHDREQTVSRIADEVDADALAISRPAGDVDRLLVSLSGDVDVDTILAFVEALVGDRSIEVTLLLATDDEDAASSQLDTAAERLRANKVRVRTRAVEGTPPFEALMGEVPDHDAIVMGERGPSLTSLVFGDEGERAAAESVGPVLVVRGEQSEA